LRLGDYEQKLGNQRGKEVQRHRRIGIQEYYLLSSRIRGFGVSH
jgi:hypothetical protein